MIQARAIIHTVTGLLAVVLCLCTSASGVGSTSAETKDVETCPDDPLVQVNEHIITRQELESYARLFRTSLAGQSQLLSPLEDEQVQAAARRNALEGLIERHLLLTEAKKVLLSREGAEEAFEKLAREHTDRFIERFGSPITFHKFLSATGASREQFYRMRRESLLIGELIRVKTERQGFVSPREIRGYYQENLEEFQVPRKIVFRQLWVDPLGCEDRRQELEKAQEILQQLREGAEFARLADEYSLDRLRYPGGLHEVAGWGELDGWLREVLASLKPGEVSDIQETSVGYCIVKLEAVVEPRMQSLEEVSEAIRRKLNQQKLERARKKLVEGLRAKAYIRRFPAAEGITR